MKRFTRFRYKLVLDEIFYNKKRGMKFLQKELHRSDKRKNLLSSFYCHLTV